MRGPTRSSSSSKLPGLSNAEWPDLEIDHAAKDFRNALQYAAIVQAKGAYAHGGSAAGAWRRGFFGALKSTMRTTASDREPGGTEACNDSRGQGPDAARDLFQRWLKEKHADEDIGVADVELFTPSSSRIRSFGKIFGWIGRTAAGRSRPPKVHKKPRGSLGCGELRLFSWHL
jgi:hypothetical protein